MVRALLAAVCCIALVACAVGGKRAALQAPPEAAPSSREQSAGAAAPMTDDPKAEITKLDDEITTARMQLELAEPDAANIERAPTEPQPMSASPATQDPKCRPAPSDKCKTSCTLSDTICGNSVKICNLAKQLPGDTWAMNKCAKANTTCEASRTKCCGCQ